MTSADWLMNKYPHARRALRLHERERGAVHRGAERQERDDAQHVG